MLASASKPASGQNRAGSRPAGPVEQPLSVCGIALGDPVIAGFLEFLLQSRGRGPATRTHDPYPGQAAKPALAGPDAVRLPGPAGAPEPQGSWFGGCTRTLRLPLPLPRPAPSKRPPGRGGRPGHRRARRSARREPDRDACPVRHAGHAHLIRQQPDQPQAMTARIRPPRLACLLAGTMPPAARSGPGGQVSAPAVLITGTSSSRMMRCWRAQDRKVMTCRRVVGPVPNHASRSCWVHSPRCRPRPAGQARNAIATVRRCLARW